jgi:hypothetical protein
MLTYQLHTRILKIEGGNGFTFPNAVSLFLKLGPGTAFGADNVPSRTIVKARAASLTINANTGRWLGQSSPPLEPLVVTVESSGSKLVLNGDELRYDFECTDANELESTLTALKWVFPALLNLEFGDPPVVIYARGLVGDIAFRWEHKPEEWRINMRTVSPEKLEQHVTDSFSKLSLFNGFTNRRLAAALHYFHVAVRLTVCGDSPWEFMSEAILNFAKTLEILFVASESSSDDIRRELRKIGYNEAEIEGDFVPLLILRSHLDVAHPRVAIFESGDLRVLYRYAAQAEERVRDVLRRVLLKVADKSYSIPQHDNLKLDAEDRKGMDQLVLQMKSRLVVPLDEAQHK